MSGGRGSGAGGAAVDVDAYAVVLCSGVTPRRRQRTTKGDIKPMLHVQNHNITLHATPGFF